MTRPLQLLAAAAVFAGATTQALAGPHDQAIIDVLDGALADWSAFLSCSVLDPTIHEQIRSWWDEEEDAIRLALADADLDPKLAAETEARLSIEHLMAPTAGDVEALVAYCADTDWRRRVSILGYPRVVEEIEDIIARPLE